MQNIIDTDLIKLAKNRQADPAAGTAAIGELYDRYHELIFRYIWSRVTDLQLAEDLTGDVFTRMVINLPKYRPTRVPFLAWLYRIARNLVIDNYRKMASQNQLPLEQAKNISTDEQSPAEMVENQIIIEQIQVALQKLKPFKQDVLILRFIVGLPVKEVASILGKTSSSIKVTQHRALKDLRLILESHTGEDL